MLDKVVHFLEATKKIATMHLCNKHSKITRSCVIRYGRIVFVANNHCEEKLVLEPLFLPLEENFDGFLKVYDRCNYIIATKMQQK